MSGKGLTMMLHSWHVDLKKVSQLRSASLQQTRHPNDPHVFLPNLLCLIKVLDGHLGSGQNRQRSLPIHAGGALKGKQLIFSSQAT